jgi:hypothetical protein
MAVENGGLSSYDIAANTAGGMASAASDLGGIVPYYEYTTGAIDGREYSDRQIAASMLVLGGRRAIAGAAEFSINTLSRVQLAPGGLTTFASGNPLTSIKLAPKGGPHGQTKLPWGDGFESHHMPPKAVNGLHPDVGPAIKMERVDHLLTSSHGSRAGSAVYRSHIQDLLNQGKVREAMATEINDARRAAMQGSGDRRKYNDAIQEMLEYARGIGYVK